MKFGTLQSVLGEQLPKVFAVAAKLGFDGVQLAIGWCRFMPRSTTEAMGRQHPGRLPAGMATTRSPSARGKCRCATCWRRYDAWGTMVMSCWRQEPLATGKRRPAQRSTCSGLL